MQIIPFNNEDILYKVESLTRNTMRNNRIMSPQPQQRPYVCLLSTLPRKESNSKFKLINKKVFERSNMRRVLTPDRTSKGWKMQYISRETASKILVEPKTTRVTNRARFVHLKPTPK